MLSTLTSNNQPALFLEPSWGAHIREALNLLLPQQPLMVAVTEPGDLWHMLHCEDFSGDLSSGRLWLLAGRNWPADLQQLLQQQESLPAPSIFIRTSAVAETQTNVMMDHARGVLTAEANRRHEQMARLIQQPPQVKKTDHLRLVLAGPSHYRLWDDAGRLLSESLLGQAVTSITSLNNSSQADEKVASGQPLDAGPMQIVAFNTDHPDTSSPLGLAQEIARGDAILTAGTGRSDLPPVAPLHKPWLTWISTGRIPSPVPGAMQDRLLLAEAYWQPAAQAAGWASDHVDVVGWPASAAIHQTQTIPSCTPTATQTDVVVTLADPQYSPGKLAASDETNGLMAGKSSRAQIASPSPNSTSTPRQTPPSRTKDAIYPPALAILVDLPESIDAPDFDLSSHTLLWEAIAHELSRDPLAVGDEALKFLHRHRDIRKVPAEGLDIARFVEHLILPAYVLGLARGLAAANIPLHLHGRNWDRYPDLAPLWRGNLDSPEQFIAAIEQAGVLVHPWPVSGPHSIEARGRLILHPASRRMETWVREAKELLAKVAAGNATAPEPILTFTRQSLLAQVRDIVQA